MWFLFGKVSSSSGSLGWLFKTGTRILLRFYVFPSSSSIKYTIYNFSEDYLSDDWFHMQLCLNNAMVRLPCLNLDYEFIGQLQIKQKYYKSYGFNLSLYTRFV